MRRLVLAFALLLLPACNTKRGGEPVRPPESAPVLAGQASKDQVITAEADKIDKSVAGTKVEAEVKASTEAQRVAVKLYPAADVDRMVKAYETTIAGLTKESADKDKTIAGLQDAEKKKQVLWLRAIGIIAVLATVALVYFGLRAFAGLSLMVAATCLGMAQLISQPWFDNVFNWTLGLVVTAFVGVGLYEFRGHARRRALTSSEEAKAKETREALLVMLEHLDTARANVPDVKPHYDAMEKDWDWSEKEILKELRAEIAVMKVTS
jgi:uncharacterized membrane protein